MVGNKNEKQIKILAISASPKKNGRTGGLLQKFIAAAKRNGAKVDRLDLYQLKPKIGNVSGKLGTIMKKPNGWQKKILDADGIVVATPTYWFNEPGILKNFIDRLTIFEESGFLLEGKVAGFIVYSPSGGETNVLENMAMVFSHQGLLLPPYSLIFYRDPSDKWATRDIVLLAKNMIQLIRSSKKAALNWDYPGSQYHLSPKELLNNAKKRKHYYPDV
ncbi:MAG: NAD(P)H-dependent oxidoreductase [Patescibacteria group bacterium]